MKRRVTAGNHCGRDCPYLTREKQTRTCTLYSTPLQGTTRHPNCVADHTTPETSLHCAACQYLQRPDARHLRFLCTLYQQSLFCTVKPVRPIRTRICIDRDTTDAPQPYQKPDRSKEQWTETVVAPRNKTRKRNIRFLDNGAVKVDGVLCKLITEPLDEQDLVKTMQTTGPDLNNMLDQLEDNPVSIQARAAALGFDIDQAISFIPIVDQALGDIPMDDLLSDIPKAKVEPLGLNVKQALNDTLAFERRTQARNKKPSLEPSVEEPILKEKPSQDLTVKASSVVKEDITVPQLWLSVKDED